MEIALDVFVDALLDCLKMLPFLFVAFLLVEWAEHQAGSFFEILMKKAGRAAPVAGSLLGCVPQCGFGVLASNLYAAGLISLGTLLSVYLSTSDEAVLILLAHPESISLVGWLLLCKLIIGLLFGFLLNALVKRNNKDPHDLCHGCGCSSHSGIVKPALRHAAKIFLFLFLVTLCIGLVMEFGGEALLEKVLLTDSPMQPLLTALVGLIPNCAASVLLTQLLLEGTISFGAAVSGLCSGAGIGLLVLFRVNKNVKENLCIVALLYILSALSGFVIQLLF